MCLTEFLILSAQPQFETILFYWLQKSQAIGIDDNHMMLIVQTLDKFGPQRRGPFNLIVILEAAVECEVRWILIILHSPRTPTTLPYTFFFSQVLLMQCVVCL